jgi:hypothetical protein
VISITCALLATLLQQWARRYLKVTQPRYSPHKRARIRAFFAEGVDKFLLPWAVEALPTMLHVSLFLFFAGLAVFLCNVNLTIFKLVLSWVGLCMALYGCVTFIPVFCHDSPYHTPLSLSAWHVVMGIGFLTFRALEKLTLLRYFSRVTYHRFRHLAEGYRKLLVQGMRKTAEESALNLPPEIDTRAFLWTFDSLDEDHELERFFSGLPGFRSSKVVKDPLPDLTSEQHWKLLNALVGLSDRTASSDLLPEPVKIRRTVVCRKAIGPAEIPRELRRVLHRITSEDQYGQVQSAEIARFVGGWDNGRDYESMFIRAIVSSVIARAQRRDDIWFSLASDEMCIPESVLRNHAAHGNSLSLAILIHVIRQQFTLYWKPHWPSYQVSKALEAASKFNVLYTSSTLQHEFCALWNEVVRTSGEIVAGYILKPVHHVYVTLHHLRTDSFPTRVSTSTCDEDDTFSYPLCNFPGHHLRSTFTRDVSAPTSIAHTGQHDNGVLVPAFLTTTPDAPSPSVPTPIHIDEKTLDVPPLYNYIAVIPSSHPAHQPAAESLRDSATSPDPPAAASAARDIDTSARTIPPTTPQTSTSTAYFPPTGKHTHQDADFLVHPDVPEIPSLAPPEQLRENIRPTGTPPTLSPPWLILTNRLTRISYLDSG